MEVIEYLIKGDMGWRSFAIVLLFILLAGIFMIVKRYVKRDEVIHSGYDKLFDRVITVQESQNLMLAVHENEIKNIKEDQKEIKDDLKRRRK